MEWRERDGARWLEASLPGARAAFSTRIDLRDPNNLVLVAIALGQDPAKILRGRQVHGAEVIVHERALEPHAEPPETDGHSTAIPGLAPLVLVADCLPIALSGPGGVSMVHGGWRGLAAGIVTRGVESVSARAAAIGPGIGPCCYEVGEEVLVAFDGLGDGIADGRMLDLREVARRLLARAGVSEVEVSELCTKCNPEDFYSYRREGEAAGRQGGFAWLD